MSNAPKSWSQATEAELRTIKGVCLDIDDTLSTDGKLTASAFAALWRLKEAGFLVVPVTGRPAGWCDHIARFWPVDAVIGENGAFTFLMEHGRRTRIETADPRPAEDRQELLGELNLAVARAFPEARWASDQGYREFDLAIDICEDVPPWSETRVKELLLFLEARGAKAKLSSIHVNTWFGEYDKWKGFTHWLSHEKKSGRVRPKPEEFIFIGDSPNDEPLFKAFKYSVGVANLSKYLSQLTWAPTWITAGASGKGFEEMADKLTTLTERG